MSSIRELNKFALNELKDYDISQIEIKRETGDVHMIIWEHEGKSQELNLPHGINNKTEVAIFRSNLRKKMNSLGIQRLDPKENNLYWKDRIEDCEKRITPLEETRNALEDMFLEWAAQRERELNERLANQDALISVLLQKHTAPIKTPEPPTPVQSELPRMAISAVPPKITTPVPAPAEKSFDALEKVRAEQLSKIAIEAHQRYKRHDLDGLLLHFLHETKGATPTEIRNSGLWRSSDSVTRYLEDMEADESKLVRFLVAEKKWVITNRGIEALEDEPEEDIKPVALPPALTPIYAPEPEPARPALAVVPKPRILAPVATSSPPAEYSAPRDKLLVYILQHGPKTTAELKTAGIEGYPSNRNDPGNVAYNAKTHGYLRNAMRGGAWELTPQGRAEAERLLGVKTPSVKNENLRRQFVR